MVWLTDDRNLCILQPCLDCSCCCTLFVFEIKLQIKLVRQLELMVVLTPTYLVLTERRPFGLTVVGSVRGC